MTDATNPINPSGRPELIDDLRRRIAASGAITFAEFMDGVRQLGLAKLIDPDDDDIATVH